MVQIKLDLPEALHRDLNHQARDEGLPLDRFLLELINTQVKGREVTTEALERISADGLHHFPDDPLRRIQETYLATIARLQPQISAIQQRVVAIQHEAIRKSLESVRDEGLYGGHHFYMAFHTRAPGVDIPDALRARYSDTMTIVLQNQFADLTVEEDTFSVVLWFGGVPHFIQVPYSALLLFTDPSMNFQMAFPPPDIDEDDMDSELASEASGSTPGVPGEATGNGADPGDAAAPRDNVVQFSNFRKK